jgi:hypothetical protein
MYLTCIVLTVIDNAAADEDLPTGGGLPTRDHLHPPLSDDTLLGACIKCLCREGFNFCSKCKEGFCSQCIDEHEPLCCPPAANRFFLDPKVKGPQKRLVGGVHRDFTIITTNVVESGKSKSSLYSDEHSCEVCVPYLYYLY